MAEDIPEIMTIGETCRYLRIPRSSLYKLAQEGKIPCQKVGRHWRFYREALKKWVAGGVTPEVEQQDVGGLDFS